MKLIIRPVIGLAVLLLAGRVPAEVGSGALAWPVEKLEQRAVWSDKELHYQYQFTNQSRRPVTVRDVATSCGCTELDRAVLKTYPPGAAGTLTRGIISANAPGGGLKR